VLAYLDAPNAAPTPRLGSIQQYDLGVLEGVPLTFTDAAVNRGTAYYLAAAEASLDSINDGPVHGVAFGQLFPEPRSAIVSANDGSTARDKLEGVAPGALPGQWWAVVDADDVSKPAELLELHVEGFD
jgi:hypothetical protein